MNKEELMLAFDKKSIDAVEFYAVELQIRRAGKDCGEFPSHPIVWRRLGFNLLKARTRKVLQKDVDKELERPKPAYTTIQELIAWLELHDGWRDMEAVTKSIKAHIDLENRQKYKTDLGDTFHQKVLWTLKDLEEKWSRRLDDISPHASADERSESNEQLSAALESISWIAFQESLEVVETSIKEDEEKLARKCLSCGYKGFATLKCPKCNSDKTSAA